MALSENKVSVQNFTKGLNTDFHELNCPPDVTTDEQNCELNRKGFRQRRLGIAYEAGYLQNGPQYSQADMGTNYLKSYRWNNINNSGTTNFLVVQTGATLSFYDLAFTPISSGFKSFSVNLDTYAAPGVTSTAAQGISVASGNGQLFVSGKLINPFYITYNAGPDTITVTPITIQIRDFIEQDAALPPNEQDPTVTPARLYDLYNQGWTANQVRLYDFNTNVTVEAGTTTVINFYLANEKKYPPKTGPWWVGKRIGDKGIEVFDPNQYNSVEKGNSLGSLGHYIYTAFSIDRSAASGIGGLTPVLSASRPTAIAFFAGKVFYALGNTIYFSQTITDTNDLSGVGKCYQEADPTAEQINNLIATDGGTIPIPDSAEAIAFFVIENSLLLFSTNGLWLISGAATNSGFSATDYSINKISNVSCTSSRTLIDADGIPIWWAPQGIFTLKPMAAKQSFEVENISMKRVQNFYDAITPLAKKNATGCWDHILKRAIWLFNATPGQNDVTNRFYYNDILILDGLFDAYIHHTISDYSVLPCSKMVDVFNIQQIQTATTVEVITDNSGNLIVTNAGAGVTITVDTLVNTTTVTHDTNYMVIGPVGISGATDTTKMTAAFADFTSCDFLDWSDYTTIGLGADFTSYLDCYYTIAGYMTPHFQPSYDAMLWMYSPYVYVYLDQPARACQTTVITIPGSPPGTTTNQLLAYNLTDVEPLSSGRGLLVDFINNKVYRLGTSPNNGILRQYDGLTTGSEISHTNGNTLGYDIVPETSEKCLTYNGYLILYANNNGNPLICVDPNTLSVVATCPTSGVPPSSGHVSTPWTMAPLRYGTADFAITTAQHFIAVGKYVSAVTVPGMVPTLVGSTDEGGSPVVCRGAIGTTSGTAIVVGVPTTFSGSTSLGVYLVTGSSGGFSMIKKATIAPSAIDNTWTNYSEFDGVCYDQTDGNPILLVGNTAAASGHKYYLAKINLSNGSVAWTSAVTTTTNDPSAFSQANIVNQTLYYLDSGNTLRIINTSTGSQTTQTLNALSQVNTQISDDVSNSIVLGFTSWTETSPTPTYFGTFFTGGGSHHLASQDARWFVGGITTPGTPNTFIYDTTVLPNASSCLLQVAWDWASAQASHKWAQQVETYRYRGNFFVATSKNKVRGKGKAMQLRFTSTSGKDFNLIGWGIWYSKNQHP